MLASFLAVACGTDEALSDADAGDEPTDDASSTEGDASTSSNDDSGDPDFPMDVPESCEPLPEWTAERTQWRSLFDIGSVEFPTDMDVLQGGDLVIVGVGGGASHFIALHGLDGEMLSSLEVDEFVGNQLWVRSLPDGGFAVAGRRGGAAVVRTYEADATVRWEVTVDEGPMAWGPESVETSRGLAIASNGDPWLLGDSSIMIEQETFDESWFARIHGDGAGADTPLSVKDGGALVIETGMESSLFFGGGASQDAWIQKRVPPAPAEWNYAGGTQESDLANVIVPTGDGGAFFVGNVWTLQEAETADTLIGRVSPDGGEEWLHRAGFCGQDAAEFAEGEPAADGGVVFVQWHRSDPEDSSTTSFALRAFDGNGVEQWSEPIPAEKDPSFGPNLAVGNGYAYVVGRAGAPDGDYFLTAIDLD